MARPRSIPENAATEVIDALGGIHAVAELTGRKYAAVHNWHASGRFPPNTYVTLTSALAAQGKTAPAALWGMVEPERVP